MSVRYLFIIPALLFVCCHKQKDALGNKVDKAPKNKVLYAVNMTAVRIESFPKYDKGGEDWDAYAPFATKPDLYLTIKWNENQLYKSETFNECEFGKPLVFVTGLPIELKPFDQTLMVEVFDEDGVSSNDNIGYFSLNVLNYKDWKTIVLSSADKQLNVAIDLEWIYK